MTQKLGAIFAYYGKYEDVPYAGLFISWETAPAKRDRFDLSAEQVESLWQLPCDSGRGRDARPFCHLLDTPSARELLDSWFGERWRSRGRLV